VPIGERAYVVPAPPGKVGVRLQALWRITRARQSGGEPAADDLRRLELWDDLTLPFEQDALGPAYWEMLRDGVPVPVIEHAGMTAFMWVVRGDAAARAYWERPLLSAALPQHPDYRPGGTP
jgi:hypothetical protein